MLWVTRVVSVLRTVAHQRSAQSACLTSTHLSPSGACAARFACTMAPAASPVLTFWERNMPFASMAAAKIAAAQVDVRPDPKATKETVATLTFPTGYVSERAHCTMALSVQVQEIGQDVP